MSAEEQRTVFLQARAFARARILMFTAICCCW
jgi:hypothetical protein